MPTKKKQSVPALRKELDDLLGKYLDSRGMPTPENVTPSTLFRSKYLAVTHRAHNSAVIRNRAKTLAVHVLAHESLMLRALKAARRK